jgi:hypothetical protein
MLVVARAQTSIRLLPFPDPGILQIRTILRDRHHRYSPRFDRMVVTTATLTLSFFGRKGASTLLGLATEFVPVGLCARLKGLLNSLVTKIKCGLQVVEDPLADVLSETDGKRWCAQFAREETFPLLT